MIGLLAVIGIAQTPPVIDNQNLRSELRHIGGSADSLLGPAAPPCADPIVALPWDGTSTFAAKAQDFESIFDIYDIFVIEDFSLTEDSALSQFASRGFGTSDPLGATDVGVRIFEDNGTGLPGQDEYTGRLRMMSVPGTGFYDGEHAIADLGGQCLPIGSYYVVWAVRLDFLSHGQIFFYAQPGQYASGNGRPDDAWQWMPGDAIGMGPHFPVVDIFTGQQTGINFILCGEPAPCDIPFCEGDWTGSANRHDPSYGIKDGDVDADDFFYYIDFFVSGDARADLTADSAIDADDFFAYLDVFIAGCD